MAEDDIYGSKRRYERFTREYEAVLLEKGRRHKTQIYRCRFRSNLRYFPKLFRYFESRDLSYIRRNRVLSTLRFVVHHVPKDLATCTRDDIDRVMASVHQVNNTPKSKETTIRSLKFLWRVLFPELDEKKRPDDTIVPYAVRHLSSRVDVSRERMRKDKVTWEEFEALVAYFGRDARMQAYLTLALESLARPQELLYVRTRDVELHDNYAKVFISEHGKEGVGLLQCIDSYPYLVKWLSQHPQKGDRNAFLFVNIGNTATLRQLKPGNVNKMIHKACKDLGINKPITCYSLKRNGVTIRRLRGESDVEIQHVARWKSTKQLKTYDMSNQDDAFKLALEKRGILQPSKPTKALGATRTCLFCGLMAGFGDIVCAKCLRPLDREKLIEDKGKDGQIEKLRSEVALLKGTLLTLKQDILQEISRAVVTSRHGTYGALDGV